MPFTIKSSCGKYSGKLMKGYYENDILCHVSLVDDTANHWFFDMIKPEVPEWYDGPIANLVGKTSTNYRVYNDSYQKIDMYCVDTPMGEITYVHGAPKTLGWFARTDDLHSIVKMFEECFEWLDTEKVLEYTGA